MSAPLFNRLSSYALSDSTEATIETPLGVLNFETLIDDVDVCGLKPSTVMTIPFGGRLLRWEVDQFQAELLLCPVEPLLPEGMAVDGCWAGVWRVKAAVSANRVEFRCEWESGYLWTEGGPDSGESLDALTYDDGLNMVTVGTEDAEALADRAERSAGLPRRWAAQIGTGWNRTKEPFSVTDTGIRLNFPDLLAGEMCQAAFLIAWAPAPPKSETPLSDGKYITTWFAVQESVENVLDGAGCH